MTRHAVLLPLLQEMPAGTSVQAEGMWESVRSSDGLHPTEYLSLPELPAVAQRSGAADTVVIVPASALSWHRVQLPAGTLRTGWRTGGAARLRTILEGLLEDQLLDEPAQLHFALPPDARDGAPLWVAVCQRQWLRTHMATLAQAGYRVQSVVPEWAPTEETSALWCTGNDHDAQWVWTDAQGVHRRPWDGHSPLALPTRHTQGPVWAEAPLAANAEHSLQREIQVQPRAQRLLDASHSPWNLAQGELTPSHPGWGSVQLALHTLWQAPAWRPARWAALALVLVQLVGLQGYAWWAQQQLAQRRAAIHSVLQSTFPATTVVIDAPLQMERAVASLRQSGGTASRNDLESLLAALGGSENFEPLMHTNSAQTAMEFVAGELRIEPLPLSPEPVEALRRQLADLGYTLQAEGTRLRLRAAAP
ncbi:type II secretion system protein GspL [Rhodoferax sp.]|uniref:type II secretion system protein GspL n=1 Tax=Rhodoferax sp. TaxID=50421 RepID=UPI002ACF071D|nr:type II secretion system protein GspL [Rhodoferax sp.]MDZ7920362.1 type II secretion system protein GspL [Rhodoferax sp.]